MFECEVREEAFVTWLKDNKPFTDRLMDRVLIVQTAGRHRLEVLHCREDDSGVYTARAENPHGNAHCTAQLVVHECELSFRCPWLNRFGLTMTSLKLKKKTKNRIFLLKIT